MIRFTLFRVPVFIQPSLWFMLLALGGIFCGVCGFSWFFVLSFCVSGFLTLLSHEMGHALVGRFFGGGQPQVHMAWLGGACCNPKLSLTRMQGIMMTAAGPLASLLIAILAIVALMFTIGVEDGWLSVVSFFGHGERPVSCEILPFGGFCFLHNLITISLWWTFLNLIPVFPLDGGQILAGLIQSMRKAHIVSFIIAVILCLVFLVLGFWVLMGLMIALGFLNLRCIQCCPAQE